MFDRLLSQLWTEQTPELGLNCVGIFYGFLWLI